MGHLEFFFSETPNVIGRIVNSICVRTNEAAGNRTLRPPNPPPHNMCEPRISYALPPLPLLLHISPTCLCHSKNQKDLKKELKTSDIKLPMFLCCKCGGTL
jgi:hypothetical protein